MSKARQPKEKAPKIARDIGRLVVQLRGEEMSREKLAELAECHPNSIGAIERGESCPSVHTLELIAKALKIKTSELLKQAGH